MAHHSGAGRRGAVAQLGERRLCKAEVGSSSLLGSTTRLSGNGKSGFGNRGAPGGAPRQRSRDGPSQLKSDETANGFAAFLSGDAAEPGEIHACEP